MSANEAYLAYDEAMLTDSGETTTRKCKKPWADIFDQRPMPEAEGWSKVENRRRTFSERNSSTQVADQKNPTENGIF